MESIISENNIVIIKYNFIRYKALGTKERPGRLVGRPVRGQVGRNETCVHFSTLPHLDDAPQIRLDTGLLYKQTSMQCQLEA